MCFSANAPRPVTTVPQYVHNPYLDGGAYGNTMDANRIGTSALTIGLNNPAPRSGLGGPQPGGAGRIVPAPPAPGLPAPINPPAPGLPPPINPPGGGGNYGGMR